MQNDQFWANIATFRKIGPSLFEKIGQFLDFVKMKNELHHHIPIVDMINIYIYIYMEYLVQSLDGEITHLRSMAGRNRLRLVQKLTWAGLVVAQIKFDLSNGFHYSM